MAAKHADSVDAEARFPQETIDALKAAGALGAAVPKEFGGAGSSVEDVTQMAQSLGENCAASAMVFAMHHIQVASIANHCGESTELRDYLRRVASEQRLIASATSEVGPSGDMRRSECAVVRSGDGFEVTKQATTISYGKFADDLLLTARRDSEAASNDQVAVLCVDGDYTIDTKGSWDTLGMRGTCSPGGEIKVRGKAWQVMPAFGDMATETMVPYSHITWAGLWLGIAVDAVNRARKAVRGAARKNAGEVPLAATNLADTMEKLNRLKAEVYMAAQEHDRLIANDREALSSLGYALRINTLKLSASKQVPEIVTEALRICGIRGYKNDSEFALGRHLRDSLSAALMVNNDRLRATNASLLCIHKGS